MTAAPPDTIAALATAPAAAGVAVVRVSGPGVPAVLSAVFRASRDPLGHPRMMVHGDVIEPESGDVIDRALVFYMPGPASFTGEDVCEIQCHGSLPLVRRILRALYGAGAGPAAPGEFTKRAFLNGKLDLVQAEAVADVVNAETEAAASAAAAQLAGRLSSAVAAVGEPLRDLLAETEASLDYPDEELDFATSAEFSDRLAAVATALDGLVGSYRSGRVTRDGFRVLLWGLPNAGKSSLLNALLGRPRAIVTDSPGTTRDLIEEQLVLEGFKVVLCDTAGVRDSSDPAEAAGVALSRSRLAWADLVLVVVDAGDAEGSWRPLLDEVAASGKPAWLVANKIDAAPGAIGSAYCGSETCGRNFYLSALTGDGVAGLRGALAEELRDSALPSSPGVPVATTERHRDRLLGAARSVAAARSLVEQKGGAELVSVELRSALSALDELVGISTGEDILDRIFSKFCIGK